tara:strand:+ start:401 stop:874 length:474 start_codon:yes stop_codon:yes gene_type:complete
VAITYTNIFWNFVLDPIRDLMIAEYTYGNIYIAPAIIHQVPFSIRMWGNSVDTLEYSDEANLRQHNIEVVLYMIEANPDENFYKQFINDGERLHQLLFENKETTTTSTNSAGTSISRSWFDGTVESMDINDLTTAEDAIAGLHSIKCNFTCKLLGVE